ncbi:hypothetical protein EDI28_26750, partial [Photobacterium chitinilyticum]
VDTGAALSIIPQNKTEISRETSSITLQAANKTKIATFEQKTLTLDLGFRRQKHHQLHFKLQIKLKSRHLSRKL